MKRTTEMGRVLAMCKLLAWGISIALMIAPIPSLAEEEGGYKGDLGDGMIEGGEDETAELARAVQNPVADLISLPFQNNTNFSFGPRERTQNVLNIQPVIPVDLTEDWLMITRTIIPVVSQPSLFPGDGGRENGLGDTLFSAFLSPRDQDLWIGDNGSGASVRLCYCPHRRTIAWAPVSGVLGRPRFS